MSLFTIDLEKCARDGICAAECPAKIINMKGEGGFPAPVAGAEEVCMNCGHCVAACPHGALSHRNMNAEECAPVQKELLPGPEQVQHLLTSRRSIRNFKKQTIERASLARLIDIARYAPTGHNSQTVHWLVIESQEEITRLAGLVVDWMRWMVKEKPQIALPMHLDPVIAAWEAGVDRIFRGAPHVIAAHGPVSQTQTQASCIIALTYLELAAYSMGLGACWAGYFQRAAAVYPPMKQAIALPEGHQVFGAMMVGHPKFQYHRIPLRNNPSIIWR